jgi:hypothetical protein
VDEASLEYLGWHSYNFGDDSYRSVSIKRFAASRAVADAPLLVELLKHPRYRDHYAHGDTELTDCGPFHGPYRLDALTLAAYEPVSSDKGIAMLEEFAAMDGGSPAQVLAELAANVHPLIRTARACFQLRELGEDSQHDFGYVLDAFHEIVAVGNEGTIIAVIVACID